jgi:hypothetical protein
MDCSHNHSGIENGMEIALHLVEKENTLFRGR